jgi:hypothetical protein
MAVFETLGKGHARRSDRLWLGTTAGLEFANERAARAEFARLTAADPAGWVLIRIGPRRYVDVRGFAMLLDAATELQLAGRRLAVVEPPRSLRLMAGILDPKGLIRLIDAPADADDLPAAQDDLHVD